MKKRKRLCWWCNGQLSAVSHATVEGRQVHKVCEPDAKASFLTITAQPTDVVSGLLANGITRQELAHDLANAEEEDGYDGA